MLNTLKAGETPVSPVISGDSAWAGLFTMFADTTKPEDREEYSGLDFKEYTTQKKIRREVEQIIENAINASIRY